MHIRRLPRSFLAACLLLGAKTQAQATVEPADFDLTAALLANGVNVSAIPALSGLVTRSSSSACSIACSSLQLVLGASKVAIQGTSAYEAFTNSYWSTQQASVDPYCVFMPTKPLDVSTLVLISRLTQCPFATKSGGHAAFAGASSIQGGITVALQQMKALTLSGDKKIATIEPGNLWYDVYTKLESENLAVIGGRVAAIGVGGLTLGGGISFFSNQYGWACDNVASFEVVVASGRIITASPTTYSDLYWALRGGGNNFGVVTKFNLETFTQGLMWGGGRLHISPQFPALINAFYNLGVNSAQDTAAAQILSFAYAQDTQLAASDLEYARPVPNPPIFSEYLSIPALQDETHIRSLSDLTVKFNESSPNGLRNMYWTATYKLDKDFINFVQQVFYEEVVAIADVAALIPAVSLQVITEPQLKNMAKKGGNALGLSPSSGPLLLLNLNAMWANAADDARVLRVMRTVIERYDAEAKKRGLEENFRYMNYASQFQAVVPSYGAASQARLKTVSKKYDPTGVFQRLVPGYFKLDGAPASL